MSNNEHKKYSTKKNILIRNNDEFNISFEQYDILAGDRRPAVDLIITNGLIAGPALAQVTGRFASAPQGAHEGQLQIVALRKGMAEHEYIVGRYNMTRKLWPAAVRRFDARVAG